jgi:heme/copper-type cytochrome/quinol oxidase subunit 4
VGLAALATIAAAQTTADHGSLVSGYRISFLVSAGIVAVAFATVVLRLRSGATDGIPA